jgi:coenzyme F420-dependent glucose-6-phosphate dehydrogenase
LRGENMAKIGYAASSEEHYPSDLVQQLVQAEDTGFSFALISDHFHPWVSTQGHSPFVWAVLGGAATATSSIQIGTGVTCPIMRIHPAILAQAAATVTAMMPGRFFFGVGTGENLNEHIVGDRWAPYEIRVQMFEEAIEIIRELWKGKVTNHWGDYYTVEDARLYTLPDALPPIMVAAAGAKSAEMAGRIGDGLISTKPAAEVIQTFRQSGGDDKPRYGQITVCWAPTREQAIDTAYKIWPNAGLKGDLNTELRTVVHFEQAVKMVRKEDIAESVICGPDPEPYVKKLQEYLDAGFDHLYMHQIGPDQAGFFDFFKRELRDHLPSRIAV